MKTTSTWRSCQNKTHVLSTENTFTDKTKTTTSRPDQSHDSTSSSNVQELQRGPKHRLNPGHMKDRVNPTKHVRKLEPHCHWSQNLSDAIWRNEPGCQVTRRHLERQVLDRKPYLLTTHILRSRSPVTISRCFGASESLGQDLLSPPLGLTTPTDEIQGRQDHSFRFLSRKKRGG